MTDKIERTVYGLLKNGEKVILGNMKMTEEDAGEFLGLVYDLFRDQNGGVFNVRSAVYSSGAFAGVSVIPEVTKYDEEE